MHLFLEIILNSCSFFFFMTLLKLLQEHNSNVKIIETLYNDLFAIYSRINTSNKKENLFSFKLKELLFHLYLFSDYVDPYSFDDSVFMPVNNFLNDAYFFSKPSIFDSSIYSKVKDFYTYFFKNQDLIYKLDIDDSYKFYNMLDSVDHDLNIALINDDFERSFFSIRNLTFLYYFNDVHKFYNQRAVSELINYSISNYFNFIGKINPIIKN